MHCTAADRPGMLPLPLSRASMVVERNKHRESCTGASRLGHFRTQLLVTIWQVQTQAQGEEVTGPQITGQIRQEAGEPLLLPRGGLQSPCQSDTWKKSSSGEGATRAGQVSCRFGCAVSVPDLSLSWAKGVFLVES